MLIVGEALKGYGIAATDGHLGSVETFLFSDQDWKIRWLVIDTGSWLSGRQVLVHPAAIGELDHNARTLTVNLTKAQIEASPDILQDQPVTMQMQRGLYTHYGWDPAWGANYFGAAGVVGPYPLSGYPGIGANAARGGGETISAAESAYAAQDRDDGDPHLRSMQALRGYHTHATDGAIGHVENFLVDDHDWAIRYLIVDTSNWWIGEHVLIAPYAIKEIDWGGHELVLSVTREQVKSSPKWDPAALIEQSYQQGLHRHYGWNAYGW